MASRARAAAPALSGEASSIACDARRSHGDPASENRLLHTDNKVGLEWLAREGFAARFRCIYLDPPYNSGRKFKDYEDARTPDAWRAMMRERLALMRPLLAEDGAIFVEIDDTELGTLQCLLDEAFGRENRVTTITVVRSASTGHKAQNKGPVNVADYLLVYASDKRMWRGEPQWRVRAHYDFAYGTYVQNADAHPTAWTFEPLAKRALGALGYRTMREATRALGREQALREVARFAMANHEGVVRFAQPRYEAVSREARAWIDRSRREPDVVHVFKRPGWKPMCLRGGNRILRLSDKVRVHDGRAVLVEPLTNVWDDVPFQGIAREGGVVFPRSKKPERLLERVLAMSTRPGDWVLDPFLGSGTTAAVAHKMGRRWVGIEEGAHLETLALPRLRRVVDGTDATGITRAHGHAGGGGFAVYA